VGQFAGLFLQLHAKQKLLIGFAFGFTLNWPLPFTLRFSEFSRIILGTVSSDPRLSVLAVTHIGHSEPNSLKRLACGVFNQALRDCGVLSSARIERKVQKEAIVWCKALDQNPDILQSALRRRLTRS